MKKQEKTKVEEAVGTPIYAATLQIALEDLIPHPAALALPVNDDDRLCASDAMNEMGYDPLTVSKHDSQDGKYYVLDGCGRLSWLQRKEERVAVCNVFQLNGANVEEFCAYRNTMRRKVTTGQRIMAYLALHKMAVIEEAIENSDPAKAGAKRGLGIQGGSRALPFTAEAIADRLHVSKKDVESGIQLIRGLHTAYFPVTKEESGRKTIVWDEASDKKMDSMRKSLDNIMKGDTPIRRWRAAAASSASTTGTARAPADHSKLLLAAMATISRSIVCIHDAPRDEQEHIINKWKRLKDDVTKHINQVLS